MFVGGYAQLHSIHKRAAKVRHYFGIRKY